MKIIATDNFDRETTSDILVATNIINREYGECMVKALNEKFSSDYSLYYYQLVEDSQKLYVFEP
jgi:hypothetical protein